MPQRIAPISPSARLFPDPINPDPEANNRQNELYNLYRLKIKGLVADVLSEPYDWWDLRQWLVNQIELELATVTLQTALSYKKLRMKNATENR